MDVNRLDIQEVVPDGHGDHLAAQHAGALLVPERQIAGYLLLLVDLRFDLVRPVDKLLLGKLIEDQLPEPVPVAAGCHPAVEIVLGARRERQHQQEFRLGLTRQRGHDVGRLHALGGTGVAGQTLAHVPNVLAVVEHGRVTHVERPVEFRLDVEDQLRIAGVLANRGGHRLHRLEQVREHVRIGLDDRIGPVEHVDRGGPVIGVDGGFDGVADVVDLRAETAHADRLRVRVGVGGGVAVQDPDQAAVVGYRQVRVGIPFDEIGQVLEALADVAIDHHAARRICQPGEEDVVVAQQDCGEQPGGDGMDRNSAGARIVSHHVLVFLGIVELFLIGADIHRVIGQFAVVDLGSGNCDVRDLDFGRRIFDQQHRQAVRRSAVHL